MYSQSGTVGASARVGRGVRRAAVTLRYLGRVHAANVAVFRPSDSSSPIAGGLYRSTLTEASTVRGDPRCPIRLPVLAPVRLLGATVDQYCRSVMLFTARRQVTGLLKMFEVYRAPRSKRL